MVKTNELFDPDVKFCMEIGHKHTNFAWTISYVNNYKHGDGVRFWGYVWEIIHRKGSLYCIIIIVLANLTMQIKREGGSALKVLSRTRK